MKVPFLDLKVEYHDLQDELDAAYQRVMLSGWYILGEELAAFEEEFAELLEIISAFTLSKHFFCTAGN